jgi:chromosome condensin MukBEF ATPase and DNA-binding subunit MukB
MFAHDFYKAIGDHYFSLATQHGQTGILPAVKKSFAIAASNLKAVISVCQDAEKKQQYLTQFNKTISFAEQIAKKIQSDPIKYDIQRKYLAQFSEQEKTIIEAASVVRDI